MLGPHSVSEAASSQQAEVHRAVGLLIAVWANVESNMIHLVGRLLGTSDKNAFITYYSFGAMRAREAYLSALIANNLTGPARESAQKVLLRFKKLSATRNELVHSEYVLNPDMTYAGTAYTRLDQKTFEVSVKERTFDKARLNEMKHTVSELTATGHALLSLCDQIDREHEQSRMV